MSRRPSSPRTTVWTFAFLLGAAGCTSSVAQQGVLAPRAAPQVDAASGKPLDMGTPFDTYSSTAHTANASGTTLENRRLLQRLMESEEFVNYDQEWWHYTFDVPDPVRFDRVIR